MHFTIVASDTRISVTVLRRRALDTNPFDADSLESLLEIDILGFSASFPISIRARELAHFQQQLQALHASLRGIAELDCFEGGLELRAEVRPTGAVEWTVVAQHPVGAGSEATLSFDFANDQTYLVPLLADLRAIVNEYPALSSPGSSAT